MRKKTIMIVILCAVILLFQNGCGVYSFTGASIYPDVKSVYVFDFQNQSANSNPALSQDLAEALRDKILSETSLSLVNKNGDVAFRGIITGYDIQALAPTGNQSTALNRLNITVKIDFINNIHKEKSWSQTFKRFADYESTQNLYDIEDQLVQEIDDQLVEDIFNRAFVNW